MISTGVCDDQKPGLSEGSLDLIGEGTRGEAASKGGGASGRSELQHCPLRRSENRTLEIHRSFTSRDESSKGLFELVNVALVTIKPQS